MQDETEQQKSYDFDVDPEKGSLRKVPFVHNFVKVGKTLDGSLDAFP